jgi:hypothetical protein
MKTTSTMSYDFGDVVLVPFPFTSQRASKKRPAVVVHNHVNQKNWPYPLGLMLHFLSE